VSAEPDLTPDFIDAVARRLLELSRRKLTAADVAEMYGVHPTWVYARADRLGAFRLGSGPKAPLRFDPETVDAAFKELARNTVELADGGRDEDRSEPPRDRRRRRRPAGDQIELLPIHGVDDRRHRTSDRSSRRTRSDRPRPRGAR
jgi:hypothetical protein